MTDVTKILSEIESGDPSAAEQLLPLVYDELRKLAASRLAHEQPGQTLQATGLVHEAYVRLVDHGRAERWNSRGHFFAAAAQAMRRILIENARRKCRLKRGGDRRRLDIDRVDLVTRLEPYEVVRLHEAIDRLASDDSTAAQLVELRYFAGISISDAATVLGIAVSTAYRHWSYARAWLHSELLDGDD